MKPIDNPPLNRGENDHITPWKIFQRGRRPNELRAGLGDKETYAHKSPRRKLGHTNKTQPTLLECWGLKDTDCAAKSPKPLQENKKFGNDSTIKEKNVIRCASHNIHNMPETRMGVRSKEITTMAKGKDSADIRLWQEIGLYWPKVDPRDRWGKRISGRSHGTTSIFAFNSREHDISSIRQPGGTAVIANAQLSSRFSEKGTDPRNLGRWAWIRCGDEGKLHTTFFSVYRPCIPSMSAGSTTYDQHLRHLQDNDPREKLLLDLQEEVQKFQNKGDNIIIGMDANENIKGRRIKTFMNTLNLKNAVFDLHGDKCPGTTEVNDSNTPVDILMCSVSLTPLRAGFDPGKCGNSNIFPEGIFIGYFCNKFLQILFNIILSSSFLHLIYSFKYLDILYFPNLYLF